MSKLRNRMIRDMQLAGLVEGTQDGYLRAVRQLAAYYMVSPDRLSERNVEKYLLYIRDELGWPREHSLQPFSGSSSSTSRRSATTGRCSRKKVRKPTRERLPDVRSDEDCRRLIASLQMPIYRACFTLIYAYRLAHRSRRPAIYLSDATARARSSRDATPVVLARIFDRTRYVTASPHT